MNSLVEKCKGLGAKAFTFGFLGLMSARQAMAALPNFGTEDGVDNAKGIRWNIKEQLGEAGILGGLALATIAFIIVAMNAVKTFHMVQEGKKSWADFAAVVLVGAVLLIICIWLLTSSQGILESKSATSTGGAPATQ